MRYIITAFLCILSLTTKAQIYNFGFGEYPFMQRGEQEKKEQYTAPSFKGGKDKLNKFIQKEFKKQNDEKGVKGKITVACIVNEKGKVSQVQIIQGLSQNLNEEAMRVAKKMKFKPAKKGKKKVKGRYDIVFPIRNGKVSFLNFETNNV